MKTTIILVLSFMLYATTTSAQKVYYHAATFDKTFTKCEQPPTFGKDSLALQQYFMEKLAQQVAGAKRQIKISVFIDSTGKTACEYIENKSNLDLNKFPLSIIIDDMPNWNIAYQNGHAVNSVGIITLTFKKGNFSATYKMGRDVVTY